MDLQPLASVVEPALPTFAQLELAIREAWAGDLTRGRTFPGVLPERLANLAAQPFPAKVHAAQAVRAAAVGLGITPGLPR